jgi:DNA-binding FrmR family transcriptional regulator
MMEDKRRTEDDVVKQIKSAKHLVNELQTELKDERIRGRGF